MYSGLTDSIWRGAGRKEAALYLNDVAVTTELLSLTISGSVNGDQEEIGVGAACARTVTIQFSGVQRTFSDGLLQVSIKAGGETLPVGKFQVVESVTQGGQTTVTAADAMLYLLDQAYLPSAELTSAWSVLSDIVDKSGITLGASVTGFQTTLSAVDMSTISDENTFRTVVGWLAALCGRNAVISRTGALEFVWYTASGFALSQQDCYEGMDQVQDSNRVFSMLAVTATDQEGETVTLTPTDISGSGGSIENDYMTQDRLDAIWADIGGLTYRPADLSFLGDLRLDAGDLISYTLADGTSCTVPAMNLTHTFDGGVTTQVTAAGQSETVSAAGGGVLTGKVKQLAADVAQLGALTVTDENGVTKINGGRIDTNSLFAQDITTEKLSIELQRAGEGYIGMFASFDGDEAEDVPAGFELVACDYQNTSDGNAIASLTLHRNSGEISCYCTGSIDLSSCEYLYLGTVKAPCLTTTYTSFSGSVVSSGSVVVTKKLGWYQVFGEIVLTAAVSDWATILDSAAVPGPAHGKNMYQTISYWGSSYSRPLRVRIDNGGGLLIRYGAAGSYDFTFTYPVE